VLEVLTQPNVLALLLVLIVALQLLTLVFVFNLSAKITELGSQKEEVHPQVNAKVDDALKQVSDKLRNAEKEQERIRRNFDDPRNRENKDNRDRAPRPQEVQNRNRDQGRDRDRDQGRDRDRDQGRDRDRQGNWNNRDRNRNFRDRDRNRELPGSNRQFENESAPKTAVPDQKINQPQETPVKMVSETEPKLYIPETTIIQAENPSEQTEDAGESKTEIFHGRRPVFKRRALNELQQESQNGAELGSVMAENQPAGEETAPIQPVQAAAEENKEQV